MGKPAKSSESTREIPVTKQDISALDRLVHLVKERRRKPFAAKDFNQFEKELGERLREVGRDILREELERADITGDAVLIEGVEHRRVLRSTERYMTTMGPVTVERTLYKDRTDPGARAIAALDAQLGIVKGFWTQEAAKQAVWVVSQMTPGLAEELFRRVGTMTPSKSSLGRLPTEISGRWEQDREHFETELRKVTVIPEGTTTLAISLDGVLAPMNDGNAESIREQAAQDGRQSKGPAGYREIGCATLCFCDEDGDMISAIRIARMPESKKRTLKDSLLAELQWIWEQQPELRVVKVADGAQDNWDFLSKQVPIGEEVIDFFHAAEHLGHALAAAYGDGTRETRLRFTELSEILRDDEDGVERVIRALDHLLRKHPKRTRIQQATGYFRKNRHRMRYAKLADQGLPIGSGPVEAACKTLVAQRMKQSGMRWGTEGGQAILTTRGWSQSDRFDAAWALVAATYELQISSLDNVVVLDHVKMRRE